MNQVKEDFVLPILNVIYNTYVFLFGKKKVTHVQHLKRRRAVETTGVRFAKAVAS